ncbi:GntR family transcriptional regulator [Hoeflea sp. YIM 152468]|uniref:GntR family transcriptional regulator n=1 Tax=Hoeflea sp. YIM 152468 TaxID=3031759 RepID=UPI0023DAD5F1|nr:GntR family transcriptional regulator [Hoeflea sp. YIM 152468]MDF1610186.1 GntR family transcriptional regulator [Hoeflea sp. YIM 152468]
MPVRKPSSKLTAIARQSLGEQVADILREQILLGDLKPGDTIPERETSAALAVSRTPLREALLMLEVEGLIEMAPARTPMVAKPSLLEVTHLLLVQSALEALAGECSCEEATEEEIEEIEAMHQTMLEMMDNPDPVEFFKIDMGFHEAIVASTKNLPLIKTHKQFHARLWRARFLSARRRSAREMAMIDHGRIVEGLRRRDKELVSSAMRQHLRLAIDNVRVAFAREETENNLLSGESGHSSTVG